MSLYIDFVGDSITVGFPGFDGFRPGVVANLAARSLKQSLLYGGPLTTIGGPQYGGSSPANFFDAIAGTTVGSWLTRFSTPPLKNYPICFRILLGTNDADGTTPAAFANAYAQLLAEIKTAYPQSAVSVGQVPPKQGFVNPPLFNAALPAVVAAAVAGGQAVVFEASPGLVLPTDFQADGIHLNALGNAKEVPVAAQGIVDACTLAGLL